MGRQFTAPRLIGLGILSAAMLAFIIWMVVTYPAKKGTAPSQSEWSDYTVLAIVCVGIVLLVDALIVWATLRWSRDLSAEELDPAGAHPELDASVKSDDVTLDPVVKDFITRGVAERNHERPPGLISRIHSQLPSTLTLQAVPLNVVLITMLCSGLLLSGSIYYGFPLWGKALAFLIPWGPLFTFEAVWKYKYYGFYTFMLVFAVLQIGHLAEHSVQLLQILTSGGDLTVAHGVFGALDLELVHFAWDSLVWLGVGVLLIRLGPHNKWLWIAFVAASFHEVEHLFLIYLDRFEPAFYAAGGRTGILASGGLIGTPFDRPYLHYIYNFFVVIPLLMALWDETKRAYNIHVAKALPSLTQQERVATSAQLDRVKFNAGQTIVRQGDPSDNFYLIASGEVEVFRDADGAEEKIGEMGPGQFFGELGLLMTAPRTATVKAKTEVELFALDPDEFSDLVARSSGGAIDVSRALPGRLEELRARAAGQTS